MRRGSDSVSRATLLNWEVDHGGHGGGKRPLREEPEWEQGWRMEGSAKEEMGTEMERYGERESETRNPELRQQQLTLTQV